MWSLAARRLRQYHAKRHLTCAAVPCAGLARRRKWRRDAGEGGAHAAMRSVGRYEIIEEIGRGGMGAVYLARQRELDRLVALKALHSVHAGAADSVARFVRESRLAGSLNHPNIVTVYEYFEHSQTPYIAMEYVPRGSLRSWTRLSLAQLVGVLEGLLAGLAAVEPSGIVHRDLKPENVMITADGLAKIADFGIAKATQHSGAANASLLTSGVPLGTPAYMAPEQALSQAIGPWTDLYSVGVIAYEQLVGRVPFHDSQAPMAILLRHVNEPIPPVTDSRPEIDPALSAWIERLLAKDPNRRTRSAAQGWDELEEIVLDILGPLWRRHARLAGPGSTVDGARESGQPEPPGDGSVETTDPSPTRHRAAAEKVKTTRRTSLAEPQGRPGRAKDGITASAESNPRPKPPRDTRKSSLRLSALALSVTATATLGFILAPGGTSSAPMPLRGSAQTRAMRVSLPTSWRVAHHGLATPAVQLSQPLALTSPYRGGTLVIGRTQAIDSTLLPSSLRAALPGSPRAEPVSLGNTQLYRYRGLRLAASTSRETIYAQPTTAGVVLGICALPTGHAATVNADCERILGSLVLVSARPLPLGPSSAYVASLTTATTQLNDARTRLGARLAHARATRVQARLAEQLADAYRRAADTLRRATPGPAERAPGAALAAALARVAGGYATMAAAAHDEKLGLFDDGRHAVEAATSSLATAIAALSKLGYDFRR